MIRAKTGADIKIKHPPSDAWGDVSVVGNIARTEAIIRDILAAKGCPLPASAPAMAEAAIGAPSAVAAHAPEAENEVEVPAELVGLFIGVGGANLKDIKAEALARGGGAGTLSIKILEGAAPGAAQKVQIQGDPSGLVRVLVLKKLAEVQRLHDSLYKGRGSKGQGKGQAPPAALPIALPGTGAAGQAQGSAPDAAVAALLAAVAAAGVQPAASSRGLATQSGLITVGRGIAPQAPGNVPPPTSHLGGLLQGLSTAPWGGARAL